MVVVLGYQLYDLARGSYGMSIRAAAFQLGLFGLVQFLPQILLAPIAGVLADRFDRRNIVVLGLMLDALVALALTLGTWFAIAPNIVPAPLMPRAVAISAMSWQIGSVAGPTLAGVLFAIHPALAYAVSAALLLLAAISSARIRPVPPPPGNGDTHPLRQMGDGLAFVWRDRFLLGCVTLDLFAVLLGGATALLPVYARDILMWHGHPVGSLGLGLMRAMPSLGASAIGLIIARRPIEHDVGARMLLAVGAFGIATAGFGLSRNMVLSMVLLAVLGAADMISVFIRNTLIQLHTPDAMRGRVSSISGLCVSASNELGEMESGLAAALLGATGAVVFGGLGAVLITVMWTFAFPELRRTRRFSSTYARD